MCVFVFVNKFRYFHVWPRREARNVLQVLVRLSAGCTSYLIRFYLDIIIYISGRDGVFWQKHNNKKKLPERPFYDCGAARHGSSRKTVFK